MAGYLRTLVASMAIAAVGIAVFAASATAVVLTTSEEQTYSAGLTLESDEYVTMHGSFGINADCESHISTEVEGDYALFVPMENESVSFAFCDDEYEVTVQETGSFELLYYGMLVSDGMVVTLHTPLGISCEYTTESTSFGTLTDSEETEGLATIDIEAEVPRTGGSAFCGSVGIWTGAYTVEATSSSGGHIYVDDV